MGVDIIGVQSGGGPFRIGSEAILRIFQDVDAGNFPARRMFILPLIGAAFSSTYEGLANYQQGQDMLASGTRQKFIDLITAGASAADINAQIPANDPLSIMDPAMLSFARTAISSNNFDPCAGDNLAAAGADRLCQALQDNDLIALLATVEYPVDVCHSPDDELVAYENVPDFTVNPEFVTYVPATGSHNDAGTQCILRGLLYATSGDFQAIVPPVAHFPGGCASSSPSLVPSQSPSKSSNPSSSLGPSQNPSESLTPSSSPTQCLDSSTWRTRVRKGKRRQKKGCNWVQAKQRRCGKVGTGKVRARDACPVACSNCPA
jgi:hypothetical protein